MPEPLTAAEIATLVEGTLIGDGRLRLTGVAPLDQASAGDLSFFASGRYAEQFRGSKAGVVFCTSELQGTQPGPVTRIVVKDPHRAMLAAVRVLFPEPERRSEVHPTAAVAKSVVIGERCSIGAHAVIGEGARLGDDVTIYPHVVIYPRTVIGSRVILHAGVRLGVDGFGYVPGPQGHEKIPHVGRCVIGDDVEIGGNTVVDRGSIGDTVIGAGTKIDNLVHIGHSCRIGRRCLIMAHVGLAGSVVIEDEAIMAGQSGASGHLTIGRRARVGGQGGVIGDVAPGASVSGFPARPHRDVMRQAGALGRLAKIVDELETLVERDGRPPE